MALKVKDAAAAATARFLNQRISIDLSDKFS